MHVARTITEQLEQASWIRRMFEEGARLKAERGAENVFDFTLGNPDIEPPAALLAELRGLAAENPPRSHAYMPNAGFPQVRGRVADHLRHETGLPYTAEHVIMTVGAAGAANTVLKALLDPGDEVIVLAPYFAEYRFYTANHGGTLVVVDTDEQFLPDIDRIRAAVTPKTKAIILNTPNNPSGAVYGGEALAALDRMLSELAQQIMVLSDEPYAALVFDGGRQEPVAGRVKDTITLASWSKTLAIPGERIGYLAISPRIEAAAELAGACTFTNRILGYVNAPAIWQLVVGELLDTSVDPAWYQERRDLLAGVLDDAGYEFVMPSGAFYMFPRTPVPDDVAFIRTLQKHGILAVPGSGFGTPGHMRLSLTIPSADIERSADGFHRARRSA